MMVRRHHLCGDAEGPEQVTAALVALHATDPASVYLSVLARSLGSSLADVSHAMYERRILVRWMAMRRTLFLVATSDVPMIQAAVSTPLAAMLRRGLISRLHRNGSEPPVDDDAETWLADLELRVAHVLQALGGGHRRPTEHRGPDPAYCHPRAGAVGSAADGHLCPPDPHERGGPHRPRQPDRLMDQPAPPLGTHRPLVAPRATRDRHRTGAAGPRTSMARALRPGNSRRLEVVNRLEQDHSSARRQRPTDRRSRSARRDRDRPGPVR